MAMQEHKLLGFKKNDPVSNLVHAADTMVSLQF